MGMTKIEILADLSGWLVRSGYLALKVVSNSGKSDKFFLFSLPSPGSPGSGIYWQKKLRNNAN